MSQLASASGLSLPALQLLMAQTLNASMMATTNSSSSLPSPTAAATTTTMSSQHPAAAALLAGMYPVQNACSKGPSKP